MSVRESTASTVDMVSNGTRKVPGFGGSNAGGNNSYGTNPNDGNQQIRQSTLSTLRENSKEQEHTPPPAPESHKDLKLKNENIFEILGRLIKNRDDCRARNQGRKDEIKLLEEQKLQIEKRLRDLRAEGADLEPYLEQLEKACGEAETAYEALVGSSQSLFNMIQKESVLVSKAKPDCL